MTFSSLRFILLAVGFTAAAADVEMCMVSVPCDITCLEYSCPVGQSLLADAANILCESSTCTVVDCCLPDPVPVGETCSNGLAGVESTGVCCMEECITCGGAECSTRVAGFGQFDCCVGPIVDTGVYCSESGEAPCIVDEDVQRCSNGVAGVDGAFSTCCSAECGLCDHSDCIGKGWDDCCVAAILESGVSCGDTVEAPCIQ